MKKEAQDPTTIITDMYKQVYDPADKAGSLSKFLGPVVVSRLMGAMGFGFYGILVGILMRAFDVDVVAIIKKITAIISSAISSGKDSFTQEEISSVVESNFEQGFGNSKSASMNFTQLVKTARYGDKGILDGPRKAILDLLSDNRSRSSLHEGSKNVLVRAFTKIFTILLSGMGLMVGGQAVKALMGKENVFTGPATYSSKKEEESTATETPSKQLKYKIKDSASRAQKSMWSIPISNNETEISRFVLKCIRNTFEVDSVSDNELTRSPVFESIVSDINIYNSRMPTDKAILMPPEYKNELTVAYPIIKSLS